MSLATLQASLDALNAKIVAAIPTASAADVAYLASALEKVGGSVSLLDIQTFAEAKKVELLAASAGSKALTFHLLAQQ